MITDIVEKVRALRTETATAGKAAFDGSNTADVNNSLRALRVLDNTIKQLERIPATKDATPAAVAPESAPEAADAGPAPAPAASTKKSGKQFIRTDAEGAQQWAPLASLLTD